MSNDGKRRRIEFTDEQIAWFKEFQLWDKLPNPDARYWEYMTREVPAGVAATALHLYEQWKRQEVIRM